MSDKHESGSWRRALLNVVIVVVVVYLVLLAGLYLGQRRLLYITTDTVPTPAAVGLADVAVVTVHTADGLDLLAWYRAPRDPDKPTLLYFCGNAGDLGHRADKVAPFLAAGYGLLLPAYRGYSGNPGTPSEAGLFTDARAALDFLRAKGIGPGDIVLYGESLGSGVALALAAELAAAGTPAARIVLEAPYTSIAEVAQYHYFYVPARWLIRDRFDSMRRVPHVAAPLLIVHGGQDRVVPLQFGRRLFAAAREPKAFRLIERAAHNNLYDFGAAALVLDFLQAPIAAPAPAN